MSITSNVFIALIKVLSSRQPIAAGDLIDAMKAEGHDAIESRRAIQLAFERGRIKLDERMRVVIAETDLAAA